jgi:Zn-dependent protease with chaperone function
VGGVFSLSNFTSNGRIRLPLLSSDAFTSPADRLALDNLKQTPLLPQIVRKYNEIAVDKFYYVTNSAESVRCGEGQFVTLYKLMVEAADVLDVTEPELYLRYSPKYSAYTAGVSQTFIVLKSALVNSLTDEELLFVLGHEIGHIKCGHVLYQGVGRMLIPLIQALGQATFGLGNVASIGIVSAFYEWLRQAEFSCDRAGLLACQNPRAALSAIMKLGCGGTRFDAEMSLDQFMEQARRHSEATGPEGISKILMYFMYNWQLSHPQVIYRAQRLDAWITSGEYEQIVSGNYEQEYSGSPDSDERVACTWCGFYAPVDATTCPKCGSALAGG